MQLQKQTDNNYYLKDVVGLTPDTVMELTRALFTEEYKNKMKKFSQGIKIPACGQQACKKKWISCSEIINCPLELAMELVNHEVGSTAYMLKVLAASVFKVGGGQQTLTPLFTMTGNSFKPTGRWQDDAKLFQLNLGERVQGRLVMGFGPSASGKTYLAKMILNILMTEPKSFISIDGGIYRENSSAYQFIKGEAIKRGYRGFDNLVASSFMSKSIFDSDVIKKSICSYLKTQKSYYNLYVPETMANPLSAKKKMDEYTSLTGDKEYIALLIYQHRTGGECPFKQEFKCRGCVESGVSRQESQGKKYSDSAYGMSMANGIKYMCGGGIRLIIHNTGDKERNIIIRDFSETRDASKFQTPFSNVIYLSSDMPLAQYLEKPPRRGQKLTKCPREESFRSLSLSIPFGF